MKNKDSVLHSQISLHFLTLKKIRTPTYSGCLFYFEQI